jgi:uncharacterized protein YkwD
MPQFYWRHWVGLSAVPLVLIVGNLNFSVSTTGIQPSIGSIAQAESGVQSSIPSPQELIEAHNLIRANPKLLIPVLQEMKSSFDPQNPKLIRFKGMEVNAGNGKKLRFSAITANTTEGLAAIDDAIADLQKQQPVLPFEFSSALSQAARDHSSYMAKTGNFDHNAGPPGGQNPGARASKYGVHGGIGESIALTFNTNLTAADVVMQWIIDDGVADRGHRKGVFTPGSNIQMGAACVLSDDSKNVYCTSNGSSWFVPVTRSTPFNPQIGQEVVYRKDDKFYKGKISATPPGSSDNFIWVEAPGGGWEGIPKPGDSLLSLSEAEKAGLKIESPPNPTTNNSESPRNPTTSNADKPLTITNQYKPLIAITLNGQKLLDSRLEVNQTTTINLVEKLGGKDACTAQLLFSFDAGDGKTQEIALDIKENLCGLHLYSALKNGGFMWGWSR